MESLALGEDLKLLPHHRITYFIFHYRGCAHTLGNSLEWFSLELEVPQKVTRVQIANRLDDTRQHIVERGHNVRITIGPSIPYESNEPLCLPVIPELVRQPGLQDYPCSGGPHEGKYVKISRDGKLNLCEAKVFTLQPKGMSWSFMAICGCSQQSQTFVSRGRG